MARTRHSCSTIAQGLVVTPQRRIGHELRPWRVFRRVAGAVFFSPLSRPHRASYTRAGRRAAVGVAACLVAASALATEQQVLVAETSGRYTTIAAVISGVAVIVSAVIPIVIFQRQRRRR